MKKTIFTILICSVMFLGITGCSNDKKEIANEELQSVSNQIIKYFQNNRVTDYENYIFNYVDEENKIVVVGLLDNSEKEQKRFKKTIIDSNLIRFVKGEKFVDEVESKDPVYSNPFIRTYNVLNVLESNNYNYLYLTIRQFQDEEVQTIKVRRELCPNIVEGKNYDFTIKEIDRIENSILSVSSISTILEIKETDKVENKDPIDFNSFIRTYDILNVAESSDYNYLYLTIIQFQGEEVQTIKVRRELCPNIVKGKNYEFTIKPNSRVENNLLSIFSKSTILKIKETDKVGLEQIQDPIPEN